MNTAGLLLCALLAWGGVAAQPPPLDVSTEDLQLDTDEVLITRTGEASNTYQFPNPALRVTEGTTINVFGVKTDGDFTIELFPLQEEQTPEALSIAKSSKGWEVKYSSASHTYEDTFTMPKDKFVWFLIERTNDYVALYRVGEAKPVLTASNKVLKTKLNFNTLLKFRVSSKKKALWDFLGYRYDQSEVPKGVKYPFLDVPIEKVKKAYKGVVAHLKRCEYTQEHVNTAPDKGNERFFLVMFNAKGCMDKKILLQLRDMAVRYRALLLVAGVKLPKPPTDDEAKNFIMDKRSIFL